MARPGAWIAVVLLTVPALVLLYVVASFGAYVQETRVTLQFGLFTAGAAMLLLGVVVAGFGSWWAWFWLQCLSLTVFVAWLVVISWG